MKRKFPLVLGLSLLTGVIGSFLLRDKKEPKNYQAFIGTWHYQKPNQKDYQIKITPQYQLYLQDKLEPVTLVELTPERLVFLDRLGYHLILERGIKETTFYDEAEDRSYLLDKIK